MQQAVEMVKNTELRERVRRQIREQAKAVLFNGEAAQPAYEAELLSIYQQTLKKWPREEV